MMVPPYEGPADGRMEVILKGEKNTQELEFAYTSVNLLPSTKATIRFGTI
jgi:hypothetical protein